MNCDLNVLGISLNYEKTKIILTFCCYKMKPIKEYDIDFFLNNFDFCLSETFDSLSKDNICLTCKTCSFNKDIVISKDTTCIMNRIFKLCNIECEFCCFKGMHTNSSFEEDLNRKIMDCVLKSNVVTRYSPTNMGEPFLDEYFKYNFLLNSKSNKNLKNISITTNAMNLDSDYILNLYKYNKNISFTVSLCSPIKEIFEKVEKKSNFDKIIENSKLLINLYNSSVNIVISNFNKDADMHENISKFYELGITPNRFLLSPDYFLKKNDKDLVSIQLNKNISYEFTSINNNSIL